ncbi:MAG: tetratricopeptide repeat protein [Candidatus Eiseniibacteriota bacterium]
MRAAFDAAVAPGLGDSVAIRLRRFLEQYPRHPLARSAQLELGELAYARGEYFEARDHFRRARPVGVSSGSEEARYWEGQASFSLGRLREARETLIPIARARRAVPRQWDAAYLVALTWAQEGRRAEALSAYRALFELPATGGEASALYQAHRLARELGRTEDATEWRARLLGRYPRSPEAASLKGEEARAASDSTAAGGRGRGR